MHKFLKGISVIWNANSSKIWTQVDVLISLDDNHYTTSAAKENDIEMQYLRR